MPRQRKGTPVHGWIPVDKPFGITSTQIVSTVRRAADAQKAGHAGTLDPLATGLVAVALGEATKTVAYLMDALKGYRFQVRWGEERATDDSEGAVVTRSDARPEEARIVELLPAFHGRIQQVPPSFSAVKVEGKRAYELARQDKAPELPARSVWIEFLRLLDVPDPDHAVFEMTCGKGTYVRALARDMGRQLGCLGHIVSLRRLWSGPFSVDNAVSLDSLREIRHKEEIIEHIMPVETVLDDIPALAVTGTEANRIRQGQPASVFAAANLSDHQPVTNGTTVTVIANDKPVAIAEVRDGRIHPVRVLNL